MNLQLSDKILVFDEPHNTDAIALAVLSDTLSDRALNQAKQELKTVKRASTFLRVFEATWRRTLAKRQ